MQLLDCRIGLSSIILRCLWKTRLVRADINEAGGYEVDSNKDNGGQRVEDGKVDIITNTYTC